MTEAEWLVCDRPGAMLRGRNQAISERKLRLFACACCRRIWHLVPPEPVWSATLELAERFADGLVEMDMVTATRTAALDYSNATFQGRPEPTQIAIFEVIRTVAPIALEEPGHGLHFPDGRDEPVLGHNAAAALATQACNQVRRSRWKRLWAEFIVGYPWERVLHAERKAQATLLRDILGNPFRPTALDPRVLSGSAGTVVHLARSIYDDRAFDCLPILADALEEAGCTSADLLAHCRSGGEHVRGCSVVDLILGKE
jgi:hypothetical protein